MKLFRILLLLPLAASILSFAPLNKNTTSQDIIQLDWLLGNWQRTNVRQGTTAFENWQQLDEHTFSGIGVSMKGSDTTFVEKLRIEIKDDELFYVADVRDNATPTYFKITEITKTGFISENPDHDFPKVINYSLDGEILTAVISDGGEKKMGFVFKKVK